MDSCATPMGGRLLRRWLHRPLCLIKTIQGRQRSVSVLLAQQYLELIYQQLRAVGDIERILTRVHIPVISVNCPSRFTTTIKTIAVN